MSDKQSILESFILDEDVVELSIIWFYTQTCARLESPVESLYCKLDEY